MGNTSLLSGAEAMDKYVVGMKGMAAMVMKDPTLLINVFVKGTLGGEDGERSFLKLDVD